MAAGLCLSGILLLLFNFNIFQRFEPGAQYLVAALAVLAAFGSFASYASARENWWRLIPGWILLALAGIIFLSTLPGGDPRFSAAVLFAGLGAAFLHIFLLRRTEFWWALIPAGFMWVLGGVIALSSYITRVESLGALLFGGIGLVFFAIYAVGDRRQWWALMPGSILLLFGFFVLTWDQSSGERRGDLLQWWPLILIALGVVVGLRSWRRQPVEKMEVNTAPARPRAEQPPAPAHRPLVVTAHRAQLPHTAENRPEPRKFPQRDQSTAGSAPGTSIEILPDND